MLSPSIPSISVVMTFENIVTVRFGLQSRMTFTVVAVAHLLVFIIASHFVHFEIRVSSHRLDFALACFAAGVVVHIYGMCKAYECIINLSPASASVSCPDHTSSQKK